MLSNANDKRRMKKITSQLPNRVRAATAAPGPYMFQFLRQIQC